jgi:hypothetical protein
MRKQPTAPGPVSAWVEELLGQRLDQARLEAKPLRGGMDAASVSLVSIRYADTAGRQSVFRYVRKQLDGPRQREAIVHRQLAARYAANSSPRLYAVEHERAERALLCVEAIRRVRAWPWRDLPLARKLLTRLACLHAAAGEAAALIPEWDYEGALRVSAEATLAAVSRCRTDPDISALAKDVAPLHRIVLALPRCRRDLLSERPFASAPIHGDVHTGNVLARRHNGAAEPVLVDWGRARVGSPLEDVSSWLQSLGYWEQVARRYHDTLLAGYLSDFGMEQKLTSQVRATYWMAGASNALAGALLHHVGVARDVRQSSATRAAAFHAARDWLRVIRRADAWWS